MRAQPASNGCAHLGIRNAGALAKQNPAWSNVSDFCDGFNDLQVGVFGLDGFQALQSGF